MKAVSDVRHAAVLGSPISHSLSPALHRAAYLELGLNWTYDAIEVTEEELATFLDGCDDTWVGLSLTMPLKETVLRLLDGASELAVKTRSVNTLIWKDGRRVGYNTDAAGIQWALDEAGLEAHGTAAVFGSGATARSAVAALGAFGYSDVVVCARRPEAVASMQEAASLHGVSLQAEPWVRGAELLLSDIVVSTVPVGVADEFAKSVPTAPGVLLDVVYSPWPSLIAQSWGDQGGTVVGGFEMLLGQAIFQVETMTGLDAPVAAMREAGEAELARRN